MEVRLPQLFIILLSANILTSTHIKCIINKSQLDFLTNGFECEISNNLEIYERNLIIESISGEYTEKWRDKSLYIFVEFNKKDGGSSAEVRDENREVLEADVQNDESDLDEQEDLDRRNELLQNFEDEDNFLVRMPENNEKKVEEGMDTEILQAEENKSEVINQTDSINSTEIFENVTNTSDYSEYVNSTSMDYFNIPDSNKTQFDDIDTSNITDSYENYTESVTDFFEIPPDITITASSINSIITYNNTIFYMPHGISNTFTSLKLLAIIKSQLKEIRQTDLKPYPDLMALWLPYNDIETLEWHLFDSTPNLIQLILMENRIKFINMNAFTNVKQLEQLDLIGNVCVNEFGASKDDVRKVLDNLSEKCEVEEEYESYFVIFIAIIALLCIIIVFYGCMKVYG